MPGVRLTSKCASHLTGDKASQLDEDATTLSRLMTISVDPASHPYYLVPRDVFAMIGDAPSRSIPTLPPLPPEIRVGPMAKRAVPGAGARRFAALHALSDQMRPFALVAVSTPSDAFYLPKRASHDRLGDSSDFLRCGTSHGPSLQSFISPRYPLPIYETSPTAVTGPDALTGSRGARRSQAPGMLAQIRRGKSSHGR